MYEDAPAPAHSAPHPAQNVQHQQAPASQYPGLPLSAPAPAPAPAPLGPSGVDDFNLRAQTFREWPGHGNSTDTPVSEEASGGFVYDTPTAGMPAVADPPVYAPQPDAPTTDRGVPEQLTLDDKLDLLLDAFNKLTDRIAVLMAPAAEEPVREPVQATVATPQDEAAMIISDTATLAQRMAAFQSKHNVTAWMFLHDGAFAATATATTKANTAAVTADKPAATAPRAGKRATDTQCPPDAAAKRSAPKKKEPGTNTPNDDAFKRQVCAEVRAAASEKEGVNEAAQKHQVHYTTIRRWLKKF